MKVILVLSFFSSFAFAHRLFWNDGSSLQEVYPIDQHIVSSFIIGELKPYQADYYQFSQVANRTIILALLAPQACPDFLPELWILAKTLSETQDAPFDIPADYNSLKIVNPWQSYQDYMIQARLGPNVRLNLKEDDFYFVVYAGKYSGPYIAYKVGRDAIGGSSEGFDALARFVRCQNLEEAE